MVVADLEFGLLKEITSMTFQAKRPFAAEIKATTGRLRSPFG